MTSAAPGTIARPFVRTADLGNTEWYLAHRFSYLAPAEDTGGALTLIESLIHPHFMPPPHVHAHEDEVFYMLDGLGTVEAGTQRRTVGPGGVAYLPRGVAHCPAATPDAATGKSRALIIVAPSGFEGFFRDFSVPAQHMGTPPTDVAVDPARFVQAASDRGAEMLPPGAAVSAWPRHPGSREPLLRAPEEFETTDVLGMRFDIALSGDATGGTLALVVSHDQPGFGPPLHMHTREDEVFYVVDGEYEFVCGDSRVSAGPGTCISAPRNIPHTYRCAGEKPGRLVIIVSPSGVEGFFRDVSARGLRPETDMEAVVEAARRFGLEILGPPL